MSHIIRGVSFDGAGNLVFEYLTPTEDVRASGAVINHALLLPAGQDSFDDLLLTTERTLQEVLTEALRRFADAEPLLLPEEDDDEPSPYDNPTERGSA